MRTTIALAALLVCAACSSDDPGPTGSDGDDDPNGTPTDTSGTGGPVQAAPNQYVYVSTGSGNSIAQFAVGTNGALSPLTPATVAAGAFPANVIADPQARYVYANNANAGTISMFTIGSNGALTPNGTTLPLGVGGYSAMHPGGSFVFATSYGTAVRQLRIAADGTLQDNNPATATITGSTTGLAFSPNGAFAYVTAFDANVVNQLSVSAGGLLAPLAPPTLAVADNPRQVAVSPNGLYAYAVSSSGGMLSLFRINADGTLTPNTPATIPLAEAGAIRITRDGKYLYVATEASIAQFIVNASGTLTANTPATVAASAFNMVTDVNDDFLYYTRFDANVGQFAIAANGTLQPISGAPATVASSGSNWGITLVQK